MSDYSITRLTRIAITFHLMPWRLLLSPQHRDHPTMCSTGFDTFCAIVIFCCGSQIRVSQQITGDADLFRSCDSPHSCCRIPSVVRGYSNAKTLVECLVMTAPTAEYDRAPPFGLTHSALHPGTRSIRGRTRSR